MEQLMVRSLRGFAAIAVIASSLVVASTHSASATPGQRRWVQRYDYGAGTDFVTDTAVSPDGSTVFVTGASFTTSENHDIATIAYAAGDGTPRWERRYAGPDLDWDIGSAIAVSPDGSTVFVTGTSWSFASRDDYASSDGKRLWVRRYTRGTATDDRGTAILVSPDSQTVFVTGQSYTSSAYAYATIAYAASDGTRLWRAVSDGIFQADAMALSPDGTRVFITGGIQTANNKDLETIALDASTGAQVWEETFNGNADGDDVGMAIGVGPSGSKVFVTGRSDGATTLGNYVTIAYGADDGSQRWVQGFQAPAHWYSHMALAVAPNGSRIVVTGSGIRAGYELFVTVAYGASGAKMWADRYDGPTHKYSYASDVAISPDSRQAIVTGETSAAKDGNDVATIAYGLTHGPRLWVRRYNGPDSLSDSASTVAIGPTGSSAYVAGKSDGIVRNDDYLTIAYSLK
jgi:hypothetical protein